MVLTGPAKQVKHTLVYIVAGGFVTEFGRNSTCPKDFVVMFMTCKST